MRVEVERSRALRFGDGAPVRAASAAVPWRDGLLVAQDDATTAAWVLGDRVERVRVLPPVEGHDLFDEASGTKHLKPDLEAAVALGADRALLLGSGSSPQRTRLTVVTPGASAPRDAPALYDDVAAALGVPRRALNLEGACLVGGRLRWFHRGAASSPSASVDLDLAALLDGRAEPTCPLRYDLGEAEGVPLAVTDAVDLPDGRVLVSLAAEDTPDPVEDGPVVAAALALLDSERVVSVAVLPEPGGTAHKVEGLALVHARGNRLVVVAVVDDDDAEAPSTELLLRVSL